MRPTMIWLVALVCVVATAAGAAQFGSDQYPIKSHERDPITNFDLRPELSTRLAKLPGQVAVGNPNGDVTLVQFYDLNCPFCREAAADVPTKNSNWCLRLLRFYPCNRPRVRSSSLRRVKYLRRKSISNFIARYTPAVASSMRR